jgi:hypothetical protein
MEGRAGWEVVTRLSGFTKVTTRNNHEIYSGPPRYIIARIDSEMLQSFGIPAASRFQMWTQVGDIERDLLSSISREPYLLRHLFIALTAFDKENMLANVSRRILNRCSRAGCSILGTAFRLASPGWERGRLAYSAINKPLQHTKCSPRLLEQETTMRVGLDRG